MNYKCDLATHGTSDGLIIHVLEYIAVFSLYPYFFFLDAQTHTIYRYIITNSDSFKKGHKLE